MRHSTGSKNGPHTWRLNLGVLLASTAIALGLIEVVLRFFLPVQGVIYTLDDRYLFRQIPGSRKLADSGDGGWGKVLVRVNAEGRRGDESAYSRAAHRVVVYGDSFIAAENTPIGKTYAAQLERLLAERTDAVAVLNAGVTGYGPDQISLRLDDDLPRLKPDVVIVAVFAGNDFGDLLRNKLFKLDGAGNLTSNTPVISPELRRQFQAPLETSSIQIVRLLQRMTGRLRSSAPPSPVAGTDPTINRTDRLLANRTEEYDSYVAGGDNVVRSLLSDEYDADLSVQPQSPSAQYRLRLMTRVLERIRQSVEKNDSHLLLLIIPEWCDVGGGCREASGRQRFSSYRPSGLTDAVARIAETDRITSLNLFEPFQRASPDGLYHRVDQHWNDAGQLLAARLTADKVLESAGCVRRERAHHDVIAATFVIPPTESELTVVATHRPACDARWE